MIEPRLIHQTGKLAATRRFLDQGQLTDGIAGRTRDVAFILPVAAKEGYGLLPLKGLGFQG